MTASNGVKNGADWKQKSRFNHTERERNMDTFWMFMAGITVGAAAMKLNDWLCVKEMTAPALMTARRRLFHDQTITHDVATAAQMHIENSAEIQRMLDYLVASMSDDANMDLMDPGIDPNRALIASGKVQAAETMAQAIDDLKTGKMAMKIAAAERKKITTTR